MFNAVDESKKDMLPLRGGAMEEDVSQDAYDSWHNCYPTQYNHNAY